MYQDKSEQGSSFNKILEEMVASPDTCYTLYQTERNVQQNPILVKILYLSSESKQTIFFNSTLLRKVFHSCSLSICSHIFLPFWKAFQCVVFLIAYQ